MLAAADAYDGNAMTSLLRMGSFAGAWCAVSFSLSAQTVKLLSTLNAGAEAVASSSAASGSAAMVYNAATNTYSLTISVANLAGTITSSDLEIPGGAPTVVANLGAESGNYVRNGNSVTGSFANLTFGGAPLKLLQNGIFVNLKTAAQPAGEIGGLLVSQPKRLYANIDPLQETPPRASNAFGAAVIMYDPGNNHVSMEVTLYRFSNTLVASHYHEAAVGVAGPVVTGMGAEALYTRSGNTIHGSFPNLVYGGNPLALLTGGAYLNYHSNVFGGGEIRGQVWPSEEGPASRVANFSARGVTGPGAQSLVTGVVVSGPEPVRMLLTARGPSLAAFGIAGTLTDPVISLYDSKGVLMASNSGFSTSFDAALLSPLPFLSLTGADAGMLLFLPPGAYTATVSSASGNSGVVLTEGYDLRPIDANALVKVDSALPGPSPFELAALRQAAAAIVCGDSNSAAESAAK